MNTETIYTVTLANGSTKVYANRIPVSVLPTVVKATIRTRTVKTVAYH